MPLPKGESKAAAGEMVRLLGEYLSASDSENALTLCLDERFEECLETCAWDLVPLVTEYIDDDVLKENRRLFGCCEQIIGQIAEKSPPDETLLMLVEVAESLVDVKVLSLLKPLQKVLLRLDSRLETSAEWCFNSIYRHLLSLPLPEVTGGLTGDERKLLDCDPAVQRIRNIYTAVVSFYDPFIERVKDTGSGLAVRKRVELKNAILRSNFRLLGKPLVFMDLENDEETKSLFYLVYEKLMDNISQLSKDLLYFLEEGQLNNLNYDVSCSDTDLQRSVQPSDTFPTDERYSPISLGVFYYLLFVEGIKLERIPAVYSPLYILEKGVYLSVIFMKSSIPAIQRKGLLLSAAVLARIGDDTVPHYILESCVYTHFIEAIFTISIYCNEKDTRTSSIKLIKVFLYKLNVVGKYFLLRKMVLAANHSGLVGYLATLYKNLLIEVVSKPIGEGESSFFTVQRIWALLDKFCELPNKATTDLVEFSDQIISTLNLIRFLVIRDGENRTGIRDRTDRLELNYFGPLRESLKLSRAHYMRKLKDIEEEKWMNRAAEKSIVSVTVGNETLTNRDFSIERNLDGKIGVIQSALNCFDVIESLICRINECIETGRRPLVVSV